MKSKAQVVSEEQAKRDAIDRENQGEPLSTIGGHIPQTSFERTQAWLNERSKKAAALRMEAASRSVTVPMAEPIKLARREEPSKPEWGDEVADTILDSKGRVRKVGKRWFGITG
jgi:hypothetical protein